MGLVYKKACEQSKHLCHILVVAMYLGTRETVLQLVVLLAVLLQDRTQLLDQRPDVLHVAVVAGRRHATSEGVRCSRVGHGRVLSGHVARVDVAKGLGKVVSDGRVVQRDKVFIVVGMAWFEKIRRECGRRW